MSASGHDSLPDAEKAAPSNTTACKAVTVLLGAHLDGQLDTVKTLEVEDHLASCETCRERLALDRAMRGSLKKAVKMATPDDVRARMLAAMAGESARASQGEEQAAQEQAEKEREAPAASAGERIASFSKPESREIAKDGKHRRPTMLRQWRTMLPLASAAALVFAWGYAGHQPVVHGMPDTVSAGLNDDLLRDFVAEHSRPVPPEQQDPKQVRQFEQYVGISYLDSSLFFTYLVPSARGWEQNDDRSIVCFITTTGAELTSSAKASKQ